jgi:hypothetical protein
VKISDMADHVRLTLELRADGDEPAGSLEHPGTGRIQRFWGWLELIATVQECLRQLRQANANQGASQ